MNSYYTLKLLTQELRTRLLNAWFIESTTPVRQSWTAIFSNGEQPVQLQFNTSSERISLFFRSIKNEEIISRKRKNRLTFFDVLNGQRVSDIALDEHDRILTIEFETGYQLRFILFGAGANVLLMDQEGELLESFRRVESTIREEKHHPQQNEDLQRDRTKPTTEKSQQVREWMLEENPKLPRPLLKRILVDGAPLWTLRPELESEERARALAREMTSSMEEHPEPRVLQGGICSLVPKSWISHEPFEEMATVNDMIRQAYFSIPGKHTFQALKQEQLQKLKGLIRKREDSLRQLADEEKTLARAEKNEKYGHILLANAHLKLNPHQTHVELDHLFYEPGEPKRIMIQVNPQLSVAQNAQEYYEKSEKGRRSIEALRLRRKHLEQSIGHLSKALTELTSLTEKKAFEKWQQFYGNQVKTVTPSLPYRQIDINGWTLWIGKNSRANEIMLSMAHKEDIWLHARGVPGSHVILRMDTKRDRPPVSVLEKAASYAAWFSKARGSSVVPVICTRRKFVTKPRKSPPGVVHVLKEEVVIAAPVCPPQSTYIPDDED